jgi:hypothetical protein
MNRILSYMPDGRVKLNDFREWKYCEVCGFCHGADFQRCLDIWSNPNHVKAAK